MSSDEEQKKAKGFYEYAKKRREEQLREELEKEMLLIELASIKDEKLQLSIRNEILNRKLITSSDIISVAKEIVKEVLNPTSIEENLSKKELIAKAAEKKSAERVLELLKKHSKK